MDNDLADAAGAAAGSPPVQWGARLGYAVSGLMHLLIAWLALQVALGRAAGHADQSGALATLARQPFGAALLWVSCAGFVLLAVWQVSQVLSGRDSGTRVKAAGKLVLYAALGWTAFTFAIGGRTSSSKQTRDVTATLMQQTGGQILVGLVGVAVLGIGGFHIYKGWQRKFLEDLQEHPGQWVVVTARIGYIAKGIALLVVGFLFLVAAAKHRAGMATGLDGALRTLRDAPLGPALLAGIAAGIAAYGIYSFARARYARV